MYVFSVAVVVVILMVMLVDAVVVVVVLVVVGGKRAGVCVREHVCSAKEMINQQVRQVGRAGTVHPCRAQPLAAGALQRNK